MTIDKIMKELIETLEFSKNHNFTTINLDVVAINEAQIRIDELTKNQGFHRGDLTIMGEMLTEAMENGIIHNFNIQGVYNNGSNSIWSDSSIIDIIPRNMERMRKYLGGEHHYSLTLTYSDDTLA